MICSLLYLFLGWWYDIQRVLHQTINPYLFSIFCYIAFVHLQILALFYCGSFFMVGFLFAYQIFLRNYKFFRISFELSHPLMFSYFLLLFNSDLLITVVLPSLKILLYKCCCGEGDFNKNCYPTRYFQAKIGRSFQLQFYKIS